jgi:UDP-glucose 4-epimerase
MGDLRDLQVRQAALRRSDIVVQAAALHAPHVGRVDEREFRGVNVGATEALLEEAERVGVRRIVYISSTSVYGHALVPVDQAVWVHEGLEPRPRDIYDETKLAAERLVESTSTPSVTMRIPRPAHGPARRRARRHTALAKARSKVSTPRSSS